MCGVLFFGSVQQGHGTDSSDLDFYIVVQGNEGWNNKKYYEGVLVEAYYYPAAYWEKAIAESQPVMFAFATGSKAWDSQGHLEQLMDKARTIYSRGPEPLSDLQINNWRITLTELLSDMEGMSTAARGSKIGAASLITRALEGYCALNKIWLTKQEKLAESVSQRDRTLGSLLHEYEEHGNLQQARNIIQYVLNRHGGRMDEYEGPRMKLDKERL